MGGVRIALAGLVSVMLLGACSGSGDGTEGNEGSSGRGTTTLVLTGGDAVLGINDLGDKGSTPGDIRTLSLTMTSQDGAETGSAEIVQTLTRQEKGVGTAVKTVVITLPKGELIAMGTADFSDFVSDTARPNDVTEKIAIIGGSGVYEGATGVIDIVVLPSFQSRWTMTIAVD